MKNSSKFRTRQSQNNNILPSKKEVLSSRATSSNKKKSFQTYGNKNSDSENLTFTSSNEKKVKSKLSKLKASSDKKTDVVQKKKIKNVRKHANTPKKVAKLPDYNYDKIENYRKAVSSSNPPQEYIRLNRFISNAGVCSRREADELIKQGKIQVNGQTISELGYKVHRYNDVVTYNGKRLSAERKVYILLNKPKDCVTTVDDPQGRRTVMDLVANACEERIYPVGRLDRMTTGLLLLTNDGELARKLSHPSSKVKKIYLVELNKPFSEEDEAKLRDKSFSLEDGEVGLDGLSVISPDRKKLGIQIHSGKNRIIRRIFEHLGYEITKLDRTVYADLTKKGLRRGKWRFLTQKEIIRLKYFTGKQPK
ncbi:MAG: rRNA pseudouridine synthase [Cytophagales bacterium]|nr:rRNA pseudouridine synthase [Cytophagales bacterium]MDW8383393.1 pseudouridine synthase [Flammeovirgaceae bacterium]